MAQRRPPMKARPLTIVNNPYPYVRCHVLRHTFEAVGAIPGVQLRPRYGVLVTFRCVHCSTVRLDVVNRGNGDLQYRDYIHPDDYSHPFMTMAQWRVLLLAEINPALLVDIDPEPMTQNQDKEPTMTFPPPTGPAYPSVLWAPNLRRHLNRLFTWLDRRRHRQLTQAWLLRQDAQWRDQYTDWFCEYGWQYGADTPDVAFTKMRQTRR